MSFLSHERNSSVFVCEPGSCHTSPHFCFIRDFALASRLSHSQPSFSTLSDDVILLLAYLFPSYFFFLSAGLSLFSPPPFDSAYLNGELSAFKTSLTSAGDTVHGLVISRQKTDKKPAFDSQIQVRRREATETK